eukprot:GFUD01101095.1.p1 GENE.GFUD01101095.1~~GFUD01101095.1.p1  ORF type:complete len:623 (-),score=238.28 GFUD01101095.1:389-2257(-)
MARMWECLSVLVLVCVAVHGQDETDAAAEGEVASGAEGEAAAGAEDAGGKSAEGGDEEAWEYVEFLKADVNEKVEVILQKTLYEAREKKGLTVLEETVGKTLEQVMEIRESLLKRIKKIRKGEIQIDPEQNIKQEEMLSEFRMEIMTILLKLVDKDAATIDKLKEISKDLLRFKMSISNEVMRMLMLPQATTRTVTTQTGDCSECDVLKEISTKIENLVVCADKEEGEDAQDAEIVQEPEGNEAGAGQVCMPPAMYAMDLIGVNELIDNEIEGLYTSLITTTEEDTRLKQFEKLKDFKSLRETIDEMITKLMSETDDEKLKKLVKRSLGRVNTEQKTKLKDCQAQCGPGGCESCAADVLYDAIAKMNDYKTFFNNTDDEEAKKEFVRTDMIKYITENNNEARDILTKKATEGVIDECDQEKSEIYKMTKAPMWMLVNTTIFAGVDELEVMVEAMVTQLEELLKQYCGSDVVITVRTTDEGPNCEWEEYQQTKEYLIKVDDIIQEALFKAKDDSAQVTAILGFVDIQGLYDKRVKKLFEEELVCPDEVKVIKKEYMTQLSKCMAQFMNGKLKFSEMSRLQRISCTKELRNAMESRMGKLLQAELEKSLNEIEVASEANAIKSA